MSETTASSLQSSELRTPTSTELWVLRTLPPRILNSIVTQKFLTENPNDLCLTEDELAAVLTEKVNLYPFREMRRSISDPIIRNQQFALISLFMLPVPSKGVSGFLKIRGIYQTETDAKANANNLIKTIDSTTPIWIVPVGRWLPLSEDPKWLASEIDHIDLDEIHKKEKQEREEKQQKKEEEMRELLERKNKLQEDSINTPDTLDFYINKKVARGQYLRNLDEMQEKIKEIKTLLKNATGHIERMDKENPDYSSQWLVEINKRRAEVGQDPITSEEQIR